MTRPALWMLFVLACAPAPQPEPEPPFAGIDVDRIFVLSEWRREQMIREAVPMLEREGGTVRRYLDESHYWGSWPGMWPSQDGPGRVFILEREGVESPAEAFLAGPVMEITKGGRTYYRPLYWPGQHQRWEGP